ncbi:phage late control D family protein [Hymenobacter volaticus]|uniref:Uncharacterized protein n=1 Tax=Hymenobacter volaticus TaxID=2932254 RepID=A0ABY4G1R4_9BACT|nr:contractile injection system protein, VgrG/Pvc8 family [Hymenobacter volaticus]UOQ64812.1 hypothetical protein MUN86_14705 [Hymenobacter volaticus]
MEVREQLGDTTTYTVFFSEDVCEGDFKLLAHPSLGPCKEIAIWVEVDDKKVYLVKGPVSSQQIKLVAGGQGSELQVQGADNTIKMKREEREQDFADVDDKSIYSTILSRNGFPKTDIKDQGHKNDEAKHSKKQNKDDLNFLRNLASENGLYFWIEYDEQGMETANVKELPLEGKPSLKLRINGDDKDRNNIDELNISWNTDVPTSVVGKNLDSKTKNKTDPAVDEPGQFKLGEKSLVLITEKCRQQARSSPKPADNDGRAQERSKAALNEAEWFIRANCSTSFDRLCKVVRAHTLVEIEGAGSRHSGPYLVSGVTHSIDAVSYKMQVELIRNAWDKAANKNGLSGLGM